VSSNDRYKPTILLVEDDGAIARACKLALLEIGYLIELDWVYTAEHAIELIDESLDRYDIVVTDFNLRGVSGLQLIHEIHLKEKAGDIKKPISSILTTAYDSPQMRRDAHREGVDYFIPKPFFLEEFRDIIKGILVKRDLVLEKYIGREGTENDNSHEGDWLED
jgi:two-component system, OmpR family, response regulator